ncbi:hypothetical protein [Lacrimispora sp.]|uniref:hypothetical protein n=1 Tax=Lacrimispora sp. TaxID=2719234 RepID=UPI0028A9DEFA|nr:hypothetical protein [Lacrimispora sp.]
MKRLIASGLVLACMTLLLAGCNKNHKTAEKNTSDNMGAIISALEDRGYTVEKKSVEKQLLTGERYRLTLNNSLDKHLPLLFV